MNEDHPLLRRLAEGGGRPPLWVVDGDGAHADPYERLRDGADWLATGPTTPQPLWGDGDDLLAVRRQPTVIGGAQGAGKTAIAGALMLGAMGIPRFGELLGYPVHPIEGKVLYLAGDRPDQARLSLLRMVKPEEVRGKFVVWPGPPLQDVKVNPFMFLEMAQRAEAGLIVLDSLKDVAMRLSEDETGSAVNQAIQHCIANEIDVISLHHGRKTGGSESPEKPRSLDDLYGSTWLTAGAGSVLYLHKKKGVIELIQMKTPNGREVNFEFKHDPATGVAEREDPFGLQLKDLIIAAGREGITRPEITTALYDRMKEKDGNVKRDTIKKRVQRTTDRFQDEGRVEVIPVDARKGENRFTWRPEE